MPAGVYQGGDIFLDSTLLRTQPEMIITPFIRRGRESKYSALNVFSVGTPEIDSKSGSWGARKGIRDGGTTVKYCLDFTCP